MAPSQSQIVTFAAGSALLAGIVFALYLIRRRNKTFERTEVPILHENTNKNAVEKQECAEDIYPVQDDTSGTPFPDREGLTISTSWAILNDISTTSSPQLSPVDSVASVVVIAPNSESIAIINGEENNNLNMSFEMDDTQGATVLENVDDDDDTLLEPPETGLLLSKLSTTDHETVAGDMINLHYGQLLKEHKASKLQTFTTQEITEALMASQNPSQGLTERNAEVLVGMLTFDDIHLKCTALQGIANCATFTHNQVLPFSQYWYGIRPIYRTHRTRVPDQSIEHNYGKTATLHDKSNPDWTQFLKLGYNKNVLREKGCLPRLASLLELQRMSLWLQQSNAPSAVSVTINAVTNLAVNQQNKKEMEACVPSLVDISLDKDTGEAVCLSSLHALTNLSVTTDHHNHYTRLVQRLYQFLDDHNTGIHLQALKILVNLSSNTDMVPHLLAAKAPERLLEFLQPLLTEEPVLLQFVTVLANILHAVKERKITSSSLPPEDKAASPETMYSALLGISTLSNLKTKVFLLCKHSNPEIQQQAIWVYNLLK